LRYKGLAKAVVNNRERNPSLAHSEWSQPFFLIRAMVNLGQPSTNKCAKTVDSSGYSYLVSEKGLCRNAQPI
ncbi:MAG: hypothetical protein ACW98Y_18460, partial [Candidatus Thorarchaeota archaeon]